jgi:hypothetical protein
MYPNRTAAYRDAKRFVRQSGKERLEGIFRGKGAQITNPAHQAAPNGLERGTWSSGVFRYHAAQLSSKVTAHAFFVRQQNRNSVHQWVGELAVQCLEPVAVENERLPSPGAYQLSALGLNGDGRAGLFVGHRVYAYG